MNRSNQLSENTGSILELYYNGGTGGHHLLWLILLGTDYRCCFKNFIDPTDEDLKTLYNYYWYKKSSRYWNSHEIEVDISATVNSTKIKNKVLLLANEPWYTPVGKNKKIVVYTDTFTQSLLSIEKQTSIGSIFNDVDFNSKESIVESAQYLANLLPSSTFNDTVISSYYSNVINIAQADAAFNLRDLVKTNGKDLLEFLGYADVDQKCKDFSEHYVSLHSRISRDFFR
jgi:hypothetical protein